jgi:hypothetical protein
MSAPKTITITKLGDVATKQLKDQDASADISGPAMKQEGKARRKTMRTFPRGILKIKGVKDPAKSPPLKRTAKKQTIQIMTDKGAKHRRKTIRKHVDKMSNEKVRALVEKNGLLKNKNTPPSLMREMLEGGVIAGFVSLD